ncbi:MAG: hypothetical protein ACKVIW_08665 [bacterium]|jgi:hypothetical protein
MPKRPFFVKTNGECVPLEGAWRTECLDGDWYVMGHHSVVPCGSERAAQNMLEELHAQSDIDLLASEAIETLGRIPESWETDSFREADPA